MHPDARRDGCDKELIDRCDPERGEHVLLIGAIGADVATNELLLIDQFGKGRARLHDGSRRVGNDPRCHGA